MKKYIKPEMELLIFDEVETVTNSTYSADQLNNFFYNEKNAGTTTTVMIQKVNTK